MKEAATHASEDLLVQHRIVEYIKTIKEKKGLNESTKRVE
jgi:hypothetical protein